MSAIIAALLESPHFVVFSRESLDRLAEASEETSLDAGQVVCDAGSRSDYVYLVRSGAVRVQGGLGGAHILGPGDAFGAGAQGEGRPAAGAQMVRAGSILRFHVRRIEELAADEGPRAREPSTSLQPVAYSSSAVLPAARRFDGARLSRSFGALVGYAAFIAFWYFAVEILALPRFAKLPGVTQVIHEWSSRDPVFGLSIYTPVYYEHIWTSLCRVGIAFALATALGVPVGLLLGGSTRFREYVFPIFELVRPIPILAWVPVAIIAFSGSEMPVLFLTFLASFFATALNTQLGVRSIEPHYILAARCLGATQWQTFWHVIVPGALPFVFTGLQVSIGVAWFSLAAAEMVSGQFGLGYVINTSYTLVQYPTIIIGMFTLGLVGYATSTAVRWAGKRLTAWRMRELALGRT